jgi:uncharacterized membrane protein
MGKQYFTTLITLILLDGIWLTTVAKTFYKKYLGYLFAENVTYWPILLFYPLYAFGILFFVVQPALEHKSLGEAVFRGALLGLVAYGAYDFTNQATIAKWPVMVTFVDLLWGMSVTALTATIAFMFLKK